MATQDEISAFKNLLPKNAADYGWTDELIGQLIDDGISQNAMLLRYWDKVAADTSEYVDMSESGSSRALSQIHKSALEMAKLFQGRIEQEENPPATTAGIRSRPIARV